MDTTLWSLCPLFKTKYWPLKESSASGVWSILPQPTYLSAASSTWSLVSILLRSPRETTHQVVSVAGRPVYVTFILGSLVPPNKAPCFLFLESTTANMAAWIRGHGAMGRAPDCLACHACVPGSNPADLVWIFQKNLLVSSFSMWLGDHVDGGWDQCIDVNFAKDGDALRALLTWLSLKGLAHHHLVQRDSPPHS